MTLPVSNLVEQMSQLDAARNLVLGDAAFYPQIVQGILPIIGPNARVELRQWGAEFLAETFASPALAFQPKQKLSATVLPTLEQLLESPEQDLAVVRNIIQTAASVYPLVFRTMYVILPPFPPRHEFSISFVSWFKFPMLCKRAWSGRTTIEK